MEDETLGFFKKTSSSHARLNVPALVQVAALAIIMIRGLDVLMIFNTLGVRGIGEFIHRSVQTWSLTLVFLSSLVLVFIEIWCAFSLVKGRRWARWLYLLTQITAASYLWAASLGYTQNEPESGSTGKAHSKRTRKQTSGHKVTMSHGNLQHKDDVKTSADLSYKDTVKTH